jgi:TonB family protein
MALRCLLAIALAVPAIASAQPASQPAGFEPPRPLAETAVPYPGGAPAIDQPVVVRVKLLVDVQGTVEKVELLTAPQPVFDEAVVAAARGFRFEPARFEGKPVPVQIDFTHTFLPPPPPASQAAPAERVDAVLRGNLREMGTRAPVAGATVVAQVGERHFVADADTTGRFRLSLAAGTAHVTVHAPGYSAFVQEERLAPDQELAVTYYVERERYDPYEIVVYGERHRDEVARVTLRGPEIKEVAGTFGDPFRVVQTLPGVASVVSLLPFPVVRGASPSSTGYLLDGTRVPLLFHLLSGPSVIHPEFIDEVRFYPGNAPVLYGGYTGGIIDGQTRRARADERLVDLDANLLEAGGLVREPVSFLGATVTAAARYGYPGLVLGLATNQASLSYWDYQLRLDGGNPRNGWTLYAFGARDELDTVAPTADPSDPSPPLTPALILGFHRIDLRLNQASGPIDGSYRVVLGYDQTVSSGANVSTLLVEPALRWRLEAGAALVLVAGLEGSWHAYEQGAPPAVSPGGGNSFSLTALTQDLHQLRTGAALAEALWRPTARLLVRPGVRADVYDDGTTTRSAVDPRLTVRYELADETFLKGGVGLYHQPPRFVLPLPGFDIMPLRYGLLASVQSSIGAELPLARGIGVDIDAYYSDLDPTIFDLAVNPQDLNTGADVSLIPTTTTPPESTVQKLVDRLTQPQTGRAYGLELLLRRQAPNGLFGWVSYTLSRSERLQGGAWVPYDFDRTHILNLVGGLPLPRNWDLGVRFQYQSGKPTTTTSGYNAARTDAYARVDVRVDKRAVWRSWLLDFYVDITNVALLPEEVTPGNTLRYVLPTVGVRGRF